MGDIFTQVAQMGIAGVAVILFYKLLADHLSAVNLTLSELSRVIRALDDHIRR